MNDEVLDAGESLIPELEFEQTLHGAFNGLPSLPCIPILLGLSDLVVRGTRFGPVLVLVQLVRTGEGVLLRPSGGEGDREQERDQKGGFHAMGGRFAER